MKKSPSVRKKRILLQIPPDVFEKLDDHLWKHRIRNRTNFIIRAIEKALKGK